jgi:hypothetical protein
MERVIEKVISDAMAGATKAHHLCDAFETMFEMWVGYMVPRLGESTFFDRMQVFDDRTFNLDGYTPTILPAPINLIEGMTSIGVDVIKPNPTLYDREDSNSLVEDLVNDMLVEDAKISHWLLFTVVEQGHPLKGLRYVAGYLDGELRTCLDDPMFTSTYDEDDLIVGGTGMFIDKRERFLRHIRPELYKDA